MAPPPPQSISSMFLGEEGSGGTFCSTKTRDFELETRAVATQLYDSIPLQLGGYTCLDIVVALGRVFLEEREGMKC